MQDLTTTDRTGNEPLLRQLSAWGIWLLVVNGMIGAGIFGVPAEAARLTGALSPLMFLFCGALILPIILCFGELASRFRGTGGPIRYAGTAFGQFAGFETGWAFYVGRMLAFAANANLLVDSASYFWPLANQGGARVALLFLLCAGLTVVNVIGARQAVRSLGVLTVLKFLPLLLLVACGAWRFTPDAWTAVATGWPSGRDFGAAAILLIYPYVGFESAVVPAGEARNPQRDMVRALIWGVLIVTALYAAIQIVSVATLPSLAASESPLLDVAERLLGPAGAIILMGGVAASVGGNLMGSMFSSPRMTYMLAREGSLPAWFGAVHGRFRTPHASIVFYGVATLLLGLFGTFAWLAVINVLVRILMYLLSIAAIPVLRRRAVSVPGPFVLPGGYVIPLLAVGVCLWLLAQVPLESLLVTVPFLLVGALLHAIARRKGRGEEKTQPGRHMGDS